MDILRHHHLLGVIKISVADPASSALIREGKKQIRDPGYLSISDHIFKSLVIIFWVKNILYFYVEDPGPGSRWPFDTGSGMERFGSGIRSSGYNGQND